MVGKGLTDQVNVLVLTKFHTAEQSTMLHAKVPSYKCTYAQVMLLKDVNAYISTV